MDVAHVSLLVAGLVIFLLGMDLASFGLRQATGRRLRMMLAYLGRNRFLAVAAGVVLTVLLNSSSAASAMMVALSGAGLVGVTQTFGVLLGSGVGTSITVLILTLDIVKWAFVLMAVGFVGGLAARREQARFLARAILGIGMVFFGLGLMKDAMSAFKASDTARELLSRPGLALVGAIALTAVIQSSAATIIMVQGLAGSGLIPLETCVLAVFGANIGTCATGLLSAITAGRRGRQVAAFNILIKIVAAAVLLPFVAEIARVSLWLARDYLDGAIAASHILFNLVAVVLFLPFLRPISRVFMKWTGALAASGESDVLPHADEIEQDPEKGLLTVLDVVAKMGKRISDLFAAMVEAFDADDLHPIEDIETEGNSLATLDEVLTTLLTDVHSSKLDPEAHQVKDTLMAVTASLGRINYQISTTAMRLARKKLRESVDFSIESQNALVQFHRRASEHLAHLPDIIRGRGAHLETGIVAAGHELDASYRRLMHAQRLRQRRGVPGEDRSGVLYRDFLDVVRDSYMRLARMFDKLQTPGPPTR